MVQNRAPLLESLWQFLRDDTGQDLVEYAILTGLIAVGSVLLFSALAIVMRNAYQDGWQQTAQQDWEPCPPISQGGCP